MWKFGSGSAEASGPNERNAASKNRINFVFIAIVKRLNQRSLVGEHTRPRLWLGAPRIRQFRMTGPRERTNFVERRMFSAKARKTAREARALSKQLRFSEAPLKWSTP